jgi:hypothetical protein
LFSDEEFTQRFLAALAEIGEEDAVDSIFSERYDDTNPRMSGLANCARQTYYAITETEETEPMSPDRHWPSQLGTYGQRLVARILRKMGYTLTDEEKRVELADGLIIGHVDGILSGLDLGDSRVIWDSKFRNQWAMFGTRDSAGLITHGLPVADPGIYMQLNCYMAAEGVDRAIVTVHPFDLSSIRREAAIKGLTASPVYRIIIERDDTAVELAQTRGKILLVAKQLGIVPDREFNPTSNKFPCSYCSWRSRCIRDGQSNRLALPPLPWR